MRDILSVVFLGTFVAFAGMIFIAVGRFDFLLSGLFATAATLYAAFRARKPIMADIKRNKDERIAAEKDAMNRARVQSKESFVAACKEVAQMMANLSDADLSVFITADQYLREESEIYRFRSTQGSPIHNLLVAMADVGMTKPIRMARYAPDVEISHVEYELTKWAREALEPTICEAFRLRQVG
ncbi:hypothetical protein [Erythrobacter sp. EC-HK427]|uniref:hypothetical protein n=1 Tax=Erythrobacter sp. EC-HK427 TaxID=2038396 RepID=UPI00125EE89D|nr:hypothetical protein [Erythrobacter sp. EC-HK427]